jgi:uncharacterized protein with beta-barrel porin domain
MGNRSLSWGELQQDGYAETGGNGDARTVAASHSTSLKSDLDAKLQQTWSTAYGLLSPTLGVSWRHEYQNTRLRTSAGYAAYPSGVSSFTTQHPVRLPIPGRCRWGGRCNRVAN